MKTKIQIKTVWGSVLFEHQADNNTTKKTVVSVVNTGADLTGAYLTGADLTGADLRGAYLTGAYLRGAYLRGADLRGAYLTGADLRKLQSYNSIVPEVGSFIGWKKAGGCLIKLEIPAKAKRHSSLTGRKCRAEFVKVVNITNNGKKVKEAFTAVHGPKTVYKIGQTIYPDSYNPDLKIECSNGIHFFISKQEALDW